MSICMLLKNYDNQGWKLYVLKNQSKSVMVNTAVQQGWEGCNIRPDRLSFGINAELRLIHPGNNELLHECIYEKEQKCMYVTSTRIIKRETHTPKTKRKEILILNTDMFSLIPPNLNIIELVFEELVQLQIRIKNTSVQVSFLNDFLTLNLATTPDTLLQNLS